jgi:serralysin
VTGGLGADTFVFDNVSGLETIQDFNAAQGDKLDISNILSGFVLGVSDIDDFLSFTTAGPNTSIAIDVDGTANGSNYVVIGTLTGSVGEIVQSLYDNGQIIV